MAKPNNPFRPASYRVTRSKTIGWPVIADGLVDTAPERLGSAEAQEKQRREWEASECPVFLYRYYSAEGHLLYVGITNRPQARSAQHEWADWRERAAYRRTELFPTRRLAEVAEQSAIKSEAPTFNKHVRGSYEVFPHSQSHVVACGMLLKGAHPFWESLNGIVWKDCDPPSPPDRSRTDKECLPARPGGKPPFTA